MAAKESAKSDRKASKSKQKKPKRKETAESEELGEDEERFVFFYSEASPFSQHHPCEFVVDDITFNCAEQYMMYSKAGEWYTCKPASLVSCSGHARAFRFFPPN